MDLGRDSPGLCLHCHQSFRSRSTLLPSDVQTPMSRVCLETFVLPSWSWTVPEVQALIKKAPETERSWPPQPNTFLVDTQIVDTVPRPSGVAGIFGQEIQQVLAIHNSAPLSFVGWPLSSDYPLSQNLPACICPSQEPVDMHRFRFSPNSPDLPHIPTHHAQNSQ